VRQVWIANPVSGVEHGYEVEHARTYRDRLVLKLRGVDDGDRAARLRGGSVTVSEENAPALAEGEFYGAQLVGLRVLDENDRVLGRIVDVVPTGGADLLRVVGEAEGGDELLVPLAREHVLEIDVDAGRVRVRLPVGLRDLNRHDR